MKSIFLTSLFLALVATIPVSLRAQAVGDDKAFAEKRAQLRAAASSKPDAEDSKLGIEISDAVLKTAEWAGFDYMGNLRLARYGDNHAFRKLLEFSGTVDGVEGIQHAVTCLELILPVSDETTALTIVTMKPKLKALLLERFQLAQGRTKKEELRKPFQEWAPLTWDAINGKKIAGSCMMHSSLSKPGAEKPVIPAGMATPQPVTDKQ